MAQKLTASMPPDLDLGSNWTVKINAVDPVTGADVSGVLVSNFSISCTNIVGGNLASGLFEPVLLRTGASSG